MNPNHPHDASNFGVAPRPLVSGGFSKDVPGGTVVERPRSQRLTTAPTAPHPFDIRFFNDGTAEAPAWKIWVYYGQIQGIIPRLGEQGDRITTGPTPAIALAPTSRTYVYFRIVYEDLPTTFPFDEVYIEAFPESENPPVDFEEGGDMWSRYHPLGEIVWDSGSPSYAVNGIDQNMAVVRWGGPGAEMIYLAGG